MSVSTQDYDSYVLYIFSVFAERMARRVMDEWINKAIIIYEHLRSTKFIKFASFFNKTLEEWTQDRKDMIRKGKNQDIQWQFYNFIIIFGSAIIPYIRFM